jgi:hypothetical protein
MTVSLRAVARSRARSLDSRLRGNDDSIHCCADDNTDRHGPTRTDTGEHGPTRTGTDVQTGATNNQRQTTGIGLSSALA